MRMRRDIRRVIEHLCDTENPLLNRMEREKLIEEVLDETLGFGPLEVLLKDPTISDILVNGPHKVYVERRGKLEKTDVQVPRQRSPAADHRPHRVEGRPARGRDEPDGGRPACRTARASTPSFRRSPWTGRALSIRRFGANPLKLEDLLNYKAFTPGDGDADGGVHQGAAEHRHQRRYRLR